MDDLSPLSIILVKKGGGGDRILFRYPYSCKKYLPTSHYIKKPMNQYFTKLEKESSFISNKDLTWENLADFPSSVLSNLFAVNPELCDSKFELKVNDVRFVGHPINLEITSEEAKYLPPSSFYPNLRRDDLSNGEDSSSPFIMFQIVFAIMAVAKYSVVECYHELCELIGNAIKSEERRTGYLTSESKILNQAQDEIVSMAMESPDFQGPSPFQVAHEKSQLAKELKQIFIDVCRSGVVDTKINKFIEVSMCIPHKVHRRHHPNTLVEPEAVFQCLEALRPYHAMILLYDEQELLDTLPLDASPAMRKVIHCTSPLKSFRTLASDADLSLNQVFQIAGHLLYWGKATVIYPVCETNVYVVSPYASNIFSNPVLDEEFVDKFPTSSDSLKTVLSWFSLPTPLSQRSPPHSLPSHQRQLAKIVVWCLQRHLLLQLHTYVTLSISPSLDNNLPDPVEEKKKRLERRYECEEMGNSTASIVGSRYPNLSENDVHLLISSLRDKKPFSEEENLQNCSGVSADQILKDFTSEERNIILSLSTSENLDDLKLFARLCGYFRGIYHLEEIMYHENLRRSQILQIVAKFKSILICHTQEDTAVTSYFSSVE
ncbi:GATOR1 complex protein NPRL3 [Lepeophtheirus salmonis]|nr:GATOR complex protein NPRL3-like [Lepeophtheirus salmonis]